MHIPALRQCQRARRRRERHARAAQLFQHSETQAWSAFEYQVPGYETSVVPATGTLDVEVAGERS